MTQFFGFNQLRASALHRCYIVGGLITFLMFVIYLSTSNSAHSALIMIGKQRPLPREVATNTTLGFEKLLALSVRPSWRTRGLKAAADLTGLDFSIPVQPPNPDELIHAFEQIGSTTGATTPQLGSAKAWFAHLDLLKFVIASGFSTTLIVEDDVDWDIHLKKQMQLISDNVRTFTKTSIEDPTPYGKNWDVLWLGHCGSAIEADRVRTLTYEDQTRCKTDLYSGWSKHFLRDNLAEGYRNIQTSMLTVCTFGYAVTAESAPKVLNLMARGAEEAFDVSLSKACERGELRCVIVNPQVMNHYEAGEGYVSLVHEGDGQGVSDDDAKLEHKMGTTGNIMKSARCQALFNTVCMRPPSEI